MGKRRREERERGMGKRDGWRGGWWEGRAAKCDSEL